MTDSTGPWPDDVMERQPHSVFLTAYIERRMSAPDSSLTVALDADWGSGKTFFVKHWAADLEQSGRGVMFFDAWKNDSASDAVLGFMAELQEEMQSLRKRVPVAHKAAEEIKTTMASMYKAVRKAIVPAASVVAGGMLKKVSGVAVDEVIDAINDGSNESEFELSEIVNAAGEGASDNLEKSLDVFFKKAMEGHRARSSATVAFRHSLTLLVKQLTKAEAINGPLYIFIDELDRCRPDYAIRLLEGIKHLFAVPGVVFIISTNLDQLSKSVQAVYRPSFNGRIYLKRFFDFESALPTPNNFAFAKTLIHIDPTLAQRRVEHGTNVFKDNDPAKIAWSFSIIADAFELTLRSQQQVYTTAAAAAASLPEASTISLIWLFFLSALRQISPDTFKRLTEKPMDGSSFAQTVLSNWKFSTQIGSRPTQFGDTTLNVPLADVLQTYNKFSSEEYSNLMREYTNTKNISYPLSLFEYQFNNKVEINGKKFCGLATYSKFVASAGLIAPP